jgi:chemotaxis protein MotB
MNRVAAVALLMMASTAAGCGYSEEQYKAQLDRAAELQRQKDDLEKQLAAEKKHVGELEAQLKNMGVTTSKLEASLEDKERALAEYKARARQLEAIKARFDLLRKKLNELTRMGIAVQVRKNRMVIELPGDVLFDTGKDTLRKDGQEILKKVATVIHSDKSLAERDYQVAGHTDNQPLKGGQFHDNWGLSVMRARSVLVFLVGPGGTLPRQHWSASGYGDTDPVASNNTKDGQQKNRRCDIVVLPDVDEMLDIRALADK